MNRTANRTRMIGPKIGLVVTTAMAGVFLSGCTTAAAPHGDFAASRAQASMAQGKHQQAVGQAEAAVQSEPRNAAYRAMLGNAYLDLGRFQSAETSFNDALALGDSSPRTALSLAVALTAQGKLPGAAGVLSQWEDRIPAADVGLALALAGKPDRGIELMVNAVRAGQDEPKLRQNLAYAYALAGRWREARVMASQDLHGDALDARIEQFAQMAQPNGEQMRIAALLGVPAGARDSGQPVHLALSNFGPSVQLAEAAPQPVPVPVGSELPAVAPVSEPAVPVLAAAEPAAPVLVAAAPVVAAPAIEAPQEPVVAVATPPVPEKTFANAFLAPVETRSVVAAVTQDANRFARPAKPIKAVRVTQAAERGSHLIQLGSFSSEQSAKRAWALYARKYPELAGHQMVISEAVVGGKHYWRVSAGGYGRASSASMCGKVKAGGAGCFAYAEGRPLPGAIDTGVRLASR